MNYTDILDKVYGIYSEDKFKEEVWNLRDDIRFFCAYMQRYKRCPFQFYLTVERDSFDSLFGHILKALGNSIFPAGYDTHYDVFSIEIAYAFYLIFKHYIRIFASLIESGDMDVSNYVCKDFYNYLDYFFKECKIDKKNRDISFLNSYTNPNKRDIFAKYLNDLCEYWEDTING